MMFAVISLLAVFLFKTQFVWDLFIFQVVISFILIIVALRIVDPRQFEKELNKALVKALSGYKPDPKDLDNIQTSFKCCAVFDREDEDQSKTPFELPSTTCCDPSQLKREKVDAKGACFSDKANENCSSKFFYKQRRFRSACVLCLTLGIIFQLQLSFNYNRQRE